MKGGRATSLRPGAPRRRGGGVDRFPMGDDSAMPGREKRGLVAVGRRLERERPGAP
jgi:hypothetical protein